MKKIVQLCLTCSLLVVASFSFGGGQSGSVEGKTEEQVTLNIPTQAGWRCVEPIWNRADLFTEQTGVAWKVHGFPGADLPAKQLSELTAGTQAYDVTMTPQIYLSLFESFMMPLNGYIERDYGSVDKFKELFYDATIETCTFDGDIKYVPFHLNAKYIVYRKDLFEDPKERDAFRSRFGYELRPPETDEQLIDIARFFTRPEEDLWGLVIMGTSGRWAVIGSLYGTGLNLVDMDNKTTPFNGGQSRDKAIEAVKLWGELLHKYKVMPPGTAAMTGTEAYEMYIGGHAAMSFGWYGDFWDRLTSPEIIEDIGESGSFVFPTKDPSKGTFLSIWTNGIPKDSPHPDEAWEFIKFTIAEDIQQAMSKESGQASPTISANEYAVSQDWVAGALMDEAARGKVPIRHKKALDIFNMYTNITSLYLAGEKTPEEFIDLLTSETETILR